MIDGDDAPDEYSIPAWVETCRRLPWVIYRDGELYTVAAVSE